MTKLRDARRTRQWSQARLVHELDRRAAAAGITLPAASTMKTQISRWENGHRAPDEMYRELFRGVFGVTDAELGFAEPVPIQVRPAGPACPELLDRFVATLEQYAAMDALAGYLPLCASVKDQAGYLDALTHTVKATDRPALLRVSARYSEFAGWLHQDRGNFDTAVFWTDRAMDCAQELGDVGLSAYVLQRKSNIATDAGRPGPGVGLAAAAAAVRQASGLSPKLRAVGLRQHANACALAGDREACLRSLGEAARAAEEPDVDDELGGYCTPSYVDMETGHCLTLLQEPLRAVEALERALGRWPAGQERDRGLCLSRLAVAQASAGELDAATATGLVAVQVLASARSERSVAQLRRLRILLAGSRNVEGANEFEQAIAALTGGAPT